MLGQPKKAAASVLLLATLALGACGGGEDRPGSAGSASGSGSGSGSHAHETTLKTVPAAEATTTVDVVMRDFKFEMPTTVKAGKVLFRVKNEGPTEHEFVIMQGTKELAEVHGVDAGKSGELAVDIPAGRYTAKCLIGSGGGRHDNLGMVQNFTVE
ncbi:MAG TPA: cupredoxin domain-containing protein [Acidimicrobiales bacterium]|nr:cupredoxin domain-containing protein [Acidimicrobiales bacterium]